MFAQLFSFCFTENIEIFVKKHVAEEDDSYEYSNVSLKACNTEMVNLPFINYVIITQLNHPYTKFYPVSSKIIHFCKKVDRVIFTRIKM